MSKPQDVDLGPVSGSNDSTARTSNATEQQQWRLRPEILEALQQAYPGEDLGPRIDSVFRWRYEVDPPG